MSTTPNANISASTFEDDRLGESPDDKMKAVE